MKYNIYLILGALIVIYLGFYIYKLKPSVNQNKSTQTLEIKPDPLYFTGDVIGEYEIIAVSDNPPYSYLVKFVGYDNVYSISEDSLKTLKNEKE